MNIVPRFMSDWDESCKKLSRAVLGGKHLAGADHFGGDGGGGAASLPSTPCCFHFWGRVLQRAFQLVHERALVFQIAGSFWRDTESQQLTHETKVSAVPTWNWRSWRDPRELPVSSLHWNLEEAGSNTSKGMGQVRRICFNSCECMWMTRRVPVATDREGQ